MHSEPCGIAALEAIYVEFTCQKALAAPILPVGIFDIRDQATEVNQMSSTETESRAIFGNKVIQQLAAGSAGSEPPTAITSKSEETHASTTIIERIANARRGYLAWLALETAAITGKEPAIHRDADASWRAR